MDFMHHYRNDGLGVIVSVGHGSMYYMYTHAHVRSRPLINLVCDIQR